MSAAGAKEREEQGSILRVSPHFGMAIRVGFMTGQAGQHQRFAMQHLRSGTFF